MALAALDCTPAYLNRNNVPDVRRETLHHFQKATEKAESPHVGRAALLFLLVRERVDNVDHNGRRVGDCV